MSHIQNDIYMETMSENIYGCENCGKPITRGVWRYSGNIYRVALCIACQIKVEQKMLSVDEIIAESNAKYRDGY